MCRTYLLAFPILIGCFVAASDAQCDNTSESRISLSTATPSRLTFQSILARYATYNAASFAVRNIGKQMAAEINACAGHEQVQLPSAMNEDDRQLVKWLKSLQGDDFDAAYLSLVKGPSLVHCRR